MSAAKHTLVWSEQGEVCCAEHAPFKGSDTWRFEHWQKVPVCHETAALKCELCAALAKAGVQS
jgi:hypothetical protein